MEKLAEVDLKMVIVYSENCYNKKPYG